MLIHRRLEFDSGLQRMSVIAQHRRRLFLALKGSPEAIRDLARPESSAPHSPIWNSTLC